MRSASRLPSPMMATAAAGPLNVQHGEGRGPLSNGSAHGAQQPRRPKQERKDKAASTRRDDSKGSGGDGDGDGDSVSTVFYSDQGESGAAASEGEGEAKTKAGVMNGFAVPTTVNGHGHGREERKSGSEISHSTMSTVVGASSGQQQRTQEQQQSQAESSRTSPKRRTPSPPPGRRSIARNRHLYRSRWAFYLANSRVLTTDGTRFV
jgi:hypothetical protein